MKALLKKLGIEEINAGACTGPDGWIKDPNGKQLISYNPTTGEEIAAVIQATPEVYKEISTKAANVFRTWREVPAPK